MNFRNLKTKVIAPTLLLIPMACMHLGDDHHGHDHFSIYRPPYQYSTHAPASSSTIGGSTAIRDDSMPAQEATTTQPQGEKGG
jgi:hypothetical protein